MFRVSSYQPLGYTLLVLEGNLNSANTDNFLTILKNKMKKGEPLILDLLKLKTFDPGLISSFVEHSKKYKRGASPIIFKNVNASLMDKLKVLKNLPGVFFEPKIAPFVLENAELLGKGLDSEIYRLNKNSILKVYYPKYQYNKVYNDVVNAKNAMKVNVPVAIPIKTYKVENRFAQLYNLPNAQTFKEMILHHREFLENYGHKFARLIKQIHQIKGDPEVLKNKRDEQIHTYLKATWLNGTEKASMSHMISLLPNADTCITGDFHPGNIIVSNGELIFVDLGDFSIGHPYQDISHIYMFISPTGPEPFSTNVTGLTPDERNTFLKGFMDTYFEGLTRHRVNEELKVVKMFLALRSFEYIEEFPLNGEYNQNLIRKLIKKY